MSFRVAPVLFQKNGILKNKERVYMKDGFVLKSGFEFIKVEGGMYAVQPELKVVTNTGPAKKKPIFSRRCLLVGNKR